MITPRLAKDRGHANHGWLNAAHSFSFSEYQDPAHMGYSALRVINEDRVAPGTGFGTHGHRDMEIITYPLSGAIRHRDSTGGEGEIRHGEVQVMHAGSGIRHSEMNARHDQTLHLLQIWIEPNALGVKPGYEQAFIAPATVANQFGLVVAPVTATDEAAPFRIHADARLFVAWLDAGATVQQALKAGRRHYLHVATGSVQVGAHALGAGDALKLEGETALALSATAASEVLLFELP